MGNGRCQGIFWAIGINFPNLPQKIRHLGNIFSIFLQIALTFLASLENYSELFPCCLIFLRRNEKNSTFLICLELSSSIKYLNCTLFFKHLGIFLSGFFQSVQFFWAAWEKNPKFPQAAHIVWIVWKTLLLDSSDIFSGNQKSVGQQCC